MGTDIRESRPTPHWCWTSPSFSVARGVCGCIIGDKRGYQRLIPFRRMLATRLPIPGCSISMEEPPMKLKRRRSAGKIHVSPTRLKEINANVAGIDCGSAEHFVAVAPDRDPNPVQSFRTFTSDLIRMAEWLTACRVTSVAI